MDSWTFSLVIISLLSVVNSTPTGYIGWPHDGAGSWWHVFRQVHSSEVASRQLLSSSRTPSSKVAETTRIIPKEERRSESSFTIISRIKSPFEQIINLLPPRPSWASGLSGRRAENDDITSRRTTSSMESSWPRQNVSNLLIIGEAEPVIDDRRHVESSRQNDGFYTIEKGLVRYRSSQQVEKEAGGSPADTHHSYPTFGLWEMLKKRRPQKWDVLNKLLTQSTTEEMPTSTSSLNWNESFSSSQQTENDDSVLVTEINSLTQEPTIPPATTTSTQPPNLTAYWNGSQSQDSGSIHSMQTVTTHQTESWLVVRVDDLTSYSATNTYDNGTLVFKRSQIIRDGFNQSSTRPSLSDIELYYPGFGQVAKTNPDRIIVHNVILASMDEPLKDVEEESQAVRPPHSIMMGNQSVLIPSNSPWTGINQPELYSIPTTNDTDEVDRKQIDLIDSNFRKIDEIKMDDNKVEHDPLQMALNLAVPAVITNVTTLPSSLAEEQMSPPLLKTLENLLLTHLHPPMTSSSSTSVASSSPPSSLSSTQSPNPPPWSELHHSELALPIEGDWPDAWQLVEPVGMSTTSPTSTTALPEAIVDSPAYYDPAINEATLSSHSVIIPARGSSSSMLQFIPSYPAVRPELIEYPGVFTTDEQSLTAVSEKPPVSASSTSTTISSSPIQMFTLRPVSGEAVVITKPPSKKNSGIASLILAHTAALISGRKSPHSSRSTNQTDIKSNSTSTLTPIAASVHVIVATPIPDPDQEEALRYRSLDSGVNHKKKSNSTSWSFPSFSQLIETPDLLHTGPVPVERPTNATPVSSWNNNQTADNLPLLPRFTCGQQTTADELVLTNPNYPDPDEHTGRCGFRLLVPSNHVCQVRVEFRDSRMLLPRRGFCLDQYMTVSESTASNHSVETEKFCGWNSDQHFYLALSEQSGPTPRHVDFQINTKAAGFPYRYSLIIQQIDCQSPSPVKAPIGCFQYFASSRTGEIKSFNFDGGQYWNKQNYRICIRSVDESCSLALSSNNGDFGLHKASSLKYPADRAGVGVRACPRDYLWIPGVVHSEETTEASNTRDRYCGTQFSNQHGDTRSNIVVVRMYSSVHIMEFRAGVARSYDARHHGPGFRIKFEQLNECPSQPTRNNDEKRPVISTEQEDYYDEALEQNDDLSSRLVRLRSNGDDIVTLF